MSVNRSRIRCQAGEGKIPLIIGILVVVGAIYLLKLTVPLRIDKGELAHYAEERTRAYVVNQISMEQLTSSVLEEAGKIGIPLKEDDVQVDDSNTRVRITIKYDVTQKLVGGKEWVQHFEIEKEVPRI